MGFARYAGPQQRGVGQNIDHQKDKYKHNLWSFAESRPNPRPSDFPALDKAAQSSERSTPVEHLD